MDSTKLKLNLIIAVTLIGVGFITLTFLFPNLSLVFLSLEVILLPAIYSYTNERNEKIMKEYYAQAIEQIESEATQLENRTQELTLQNEILKKELSYPRKRK